GGRSFGLGPVHGHRVGHGPLECGGLLGGSLLGGSLLGSGLLGSGLLGGGLLSGFGFLGGLLEDHDLRGELSAHELQPLDERGGGGIVEVGLLGGDGGRISTGGGGDGDRRGGDGGGDRGCGHEGSARYGRR